LPIDNLSGDSTKAYLADGLTADLIDKLFRLEGLRIPGTATVARYRGKRPDPIQVGQELGVNAVVTGNMSEVGGRPRVTLQLVDAADGFVRWSGAYDQRDPTAQADIARVLAESLRVQLRPKSIAPTRSSTRDTAAYRLYLQGRHLVKQVGRESVRQGLRALEQAIARDSGFGEAWAALPVAYGLLGQLGGLTPAESQLLQRRAVERAIALDSLNGEAYSARAHLRVQYEWDYAGADRDYRRAIELTPGSALNHMLYSQFLGVVGRDDSSLAVMRRGMALDPTASWLIANHSYALLKVGRAREALAEAERALRYDSTQWVAYHLRAWSYKALGQPDRTLEDLKRALQIVGDTVPFLLGPIGEQLALQGRREEAETVLAKLERLDSEDYVWNSRVRLALGDRNGALEALERSARNREGWLSEMLSSGSLEALRAEPRYEAVLRQVGITNVRTRK
jgi:serine/threonine-protein kinase